MMHPTNHNKLYAGTGGAPGIYISMDGATSWNSLPLYRNVVSLALDPINDQYIYAGSANGFASSFDGGTTWSISTDATIINCHVRAIIVNPLNPNIIYVGTWYNGVFKSKDRGNTWASMTSGLTPSRIWSTSF